MRFTKAVSIRTIFVLMFGVACFCAGWLGHKSESERKADLAKSEFNRFLLAQKNESLANSIVSTGIAATAEVSHETDGTLQFIVEFPVGCDRQDASEKIRQQAMKSYRNLAAENIVVYEKPVKR